MCDEGRVRELVALIDSEKDSEQVALLAAELERLLSTESLSKIDGSTHPHEQSLGSDNNARFVPLASSSDANPRST
jgi:hypothetical protein